jgi:hypothetical protein
MESEMHGATQTILHDAAHPSYLEVPVVDRELGGSSVAKSDRPAIVRKIASDD